MAFDVNKPADTQTIALGPADIRENFRALKDDKIVAAATAETSADAQAHIDDAIDAHAGSAIGITVTGYGKGLSTAETTVQKVADRVNQNGTPQFVTDASKCSLLLDFKNGLADKTLGIVPVNYNSANKWSDNYINDNSSKEVATNLSCTFKQFEGDEGKFGSGVAVEESRTNLLTYSDDLTNAAWTKNNCTITLDRILPDGRKLFKITVNTTADASITQPITFGNQAYSFQAFMQYANKTYSWSLYNGDIGAVLFVNKINDTANKLTKFTGTNTPSASKTGIIQMYIANPTAGDTFYITSPQLEAGAFPTSYIATGATAVTRPAPMLTYDKSDMLNSSNYSLSFWVKHNFAWDEAVSFANGLFSFGTSPSHTIYYDARYSRYQVGFGSGLNGYKVGAANFNDWKHFIITQNGTIGKVYINNSKVLEVSNATPIDLSALTLGKYRGFPANSIISNFAIFNYALSADEISQIYNSGLEGKPVVCSNPVNHQDIVRETAGSPNNLIMPMFFGESVYDTTNNAWYKSKKIDNSTFVNPAWLQMN